MEFAELITRLTSAAARGDGQGVADCFTPDGVYHDVFYGAFVGPDIKAMIEDYFHRDGQNFRWDVHDPIDNGRIGYARYVFSYESKLSGSQGKRAIFEGVAVCELADGRISSYKEIANAATGLSCLGFAPERLAKFVDRQTKELSARDEAKQHVA